MRMMLPILSCLLLLGASPAVAELPPDQDYVQVIDGHLSLNGERQRYWATTGQVYARANVLPADTPAQAEAKVERARRGTDLLLARYRALGFNAIRLWDGFPDGGPYTLNDGSKMDDVDYFIAKAGEAGFKFWMAGLNRTGEVRPDDAKVIDDPATADAWADAVRAMCKAKNGRITRGWKLGKNLARIWDPRLQQIGIDRMSAVATHMNQHNGLRWCDDPTFIIWELSNEEWWMRRMVTGQWQKLPPFFKNQLVVRWNAFLVEKYGTQEKLAEAWGGLLPGEQLDRGTVLFAPMAGTTVTATSINDANKHAAEAVKALEQAYERSDFAAQRGSDVLEFLVGLQLAHKRKEEAAIKALGKSTRLSPMIYDTGIGYEIQSQHLHQNADAVAHNAYVNGGGPKLEDLLKKAEEQPNEHQRQRVTLEAERNSANVGRWNNWLLKPPGIAQGVPWLEHNRVEGKPFLVYETQIQQAAKYRADFPLRLTMLAAIQDWDWVTWFYFGDGQLTQAVGAEPKPFERRMDVTIGGHPQGYHYTYDEVQNSMMRAAGYMFTQHKLKPAPNPTTFIYGRQSLYDPDSMDYGGSYGQTGLDMLQTVYQYGSRIKIDPTREDDEVVGPVVKFTDRHTHNPYTPTEELVFDWKQGYVSIDSPQAVAWTGLLGRTDGQVTFKHGVTLSGVTINNPEGIFDPVDDERYIAFSLYTRDGKPLAETKQASASLVSTSFNAGYRPRQQGEKRGTAGELPVLVARVGGTIESDAIDGMAYAFLDWNLDTIATGTVTGGKLRIPDDQPVFTVELTRSK